MNLQDIEALIKDEIKKLKTDGEEGTINGYYGSYECEQNEYKILDLLKQYFSYDYEQDEKRNKYCLHATQIEIWQYYLDVILPRIKKGIQF